MYFPRVVVVKNKTEMTDVSSAWSAAIAGMGLGITRCTISYPFDVVKTLAQKRNEKPMHVFRSLLATSPRAFFKGYSVTTFGVSAERALQFAMFETWLSNKHNPYAAAFFAAVPCSLISVPTLSIVSNTIVSGKTPRQVISENLSKHGLAYFFRAYPFEILRSVVASTVYVGTYGYVRDKTQGTSPTPAKTAFAAISAGMAVWAVQYPYDTVRTVYQTSPERNASLFSVFRSHTRLHGYSSLWNGISVVFLRTIPSATVGMLVYEAIRKNLATKN